MFLVIGRTRVRHWIVLLFLKMFLEDLSPFCGATDIPVLDFW